MQLTTQAVETIVRKLASAPKGELEQCAKDLKSIASDDGQTWQVRMAAKGLAILVRKQIRAF